jgi:hypothetical protein
MKSQQKRTPAKKQKQQASDMTDTITITSGASDVDVIDLGDTIDMSSWTIGSGGYSNITGSITVPTTTTWTQDYSITSASYGNTFVSIDSDGITMKEGTDIMIGGRKLGEVIAQIEDRLAILRPNEELESKWESLKELRRQYEALEKDILEKEKIMKILKEK